MARPLIGNDEDSEEFDVARDKEVLESDPEEKEPNNLNETF